VTLLPIARPIHAPAPSTRTICGWGWDTARPDLPIKVDLFDGNLGL